MGGRSRNNGLRLAATVQSVSSTGQVSLEVSPKRNAP